MHPLIGSETKFVSIFEGRLPRFDLIQVAVWPIKTALIVFLNIVNKFVRQNPSQPGWPLEPGGVYPNSRPIRGKLTPGCTVHKRIIRTVATPKVKRGPTAGIWINHARV